MNEQQEALKTVFSQNRTEELGLDVWEHFVVPPFFNNMDLHQARKPRLIVGGRGCGKTMLLRYMSYHTAFSQHRQQIPADAIRHIGLYWRADTQFLKLMTGRNKGLDTWENAFDHMVALTVGAEVLNSIQTVCERSLLDVTWAELEEAQLSGLGSYDPELGGAFAAAQKTFRSKLREFELWVANASKIAEPVFLPGRRFIVSLIDECRSAIPSLKDAAFFVYLDEYENLLEYQQRMINTCLKHSEIPLIFNLAMKRNAFVTEQTVGVESITNVQDYREFDIEDYLEDDFGVFAAEVLLLTLHTAGWEVPIDTDLLRDPDQLQMRREAAYRQAVLNFARKLYPGRSTEELASDVFDSKMTRSKLTEKVEQALKQRGNTSLSACQFVKPEVPEASIVTSALLYRRLDPNDIIRELESLVEGKPNKFTGDTDWIHNNFVGCLLALYESCPQVCPWYAGFDTFVSLAKGNLRHFLELCHQSLVDLPSGQQLNNMNVDVRTQAQAARHTSTTFLRQVKSFGRHGNQLHSFVLRLGSLFSLAHRRPTQSEPEQSHFSFTRGNASLEADDRDFIKEAVKWSVLFEVPITKSKDPLTATEDFEYVLNPIYAPYFNITYRKKRRLELSVEDFITLERGSYADVTRLLRSFSEKWKVNLQEVDRNLFSHLLEG